MNNSRLGFAARLMMFAAAVIATDLAAGRWVVKARSYMSEDFWSGSMTGIRSYHTKNDGSRVLIVRNRLTGLTVTTVARPATWQGLCRVWWPAVASLSLTLLALVIALTHTGRGF